MKQQLVFFALIIVVWASCSLSLVNVYMDFHMSSIIKEKHVVYCTAKLYLSTSLFAHIRFMNPVKVVQSVFQ